MIDHINTCKKINVQYLTSTLISRSNLGQNSLNVTKPAHSDLRTLYVLVIDCFVWDYDQNKLIKVTKHHKTEKHKTKLEHTKLYETLACHPYPSLLLCSDSSFGT
jgi:hypothetical protein